MCASGSGRIRTWHLARANLPSQSLIAGQDGRLPRYRCTRTIPIVIGSRIFWFDSKHPRSLSARSLKAIPSSKNWIIAKGRIRSQYLVERVS